MIEDKLLQDEISGLFMLRLKADQDAWSDFRSSVASSMASYFYGNCIKPWALSGQPKKSDPSALCMALIRRSAKPVKEMRNV